jgi:hypothetical protein|nr:MAG TPA: hypothetical protein [Caudoviricetes sp.]
MKAKSTQDLTLLAMAAYEAMKKEAGKNETEKKPQKPRSK